MPRKPAKPVVKKQRSKKPFSVRSREGWFYADKKGVIVNFYKRMAPYQSCSPHLVLFDRHKNPRFTLSYFTFLERNKVVGGKPIVPNGVICIESIQRIRTKYKKKEGRESFVPSPEAETKASRELQKELGVHP